MQFGLVNGIPVIGGRATSANERLPDMPGGGTPGTPIASEFSEGVSLQKDGRIQNHDRPEAAGSWPNRAPAEQARNVEGWAARGVSPRHCHRHLDSCFHCRFSNRVTATYPTCHRTRRLAGSSAALQNQAQSIVTGRSKITRRQCET